MPAERYDVIGVGNAIVDVIAQTGDDFIVAHQLERGAMRLIDAEAAVRLYEAMPPSIEASGGSAANTMAGLASFGGRVAYIGKVRDDQLGAVFRHDLRAAGVDFEVPLAPTGAPTGRSLIIVTPDAERTMSTFLGIAADLEPDDVDEEACAAAGVAYCEGYLWDVESAKQAMRKVMAATKRAGGKVALSLSDGFCVERHRDEFLQLAEEYVDLLFANESEVCSLYEVDDVEAAVARVKGHCEVAAITLSARGSVIVTEGERVEVAAWSTGSVIDTTGAGDQYAAGFLHGYAAGCPLEICGRLGSLAAGEVISHVGPRPSQSLRKLSASHGLL